MSGLAGAPAKESPASGAGAGADAAEVRQVHRQHDKKSILPQKVLQVPLQGNQSNPPACSSAEVEGKADAHWPSHSV